VRCFCSSGLERFGIGEALNGKEGEAFEDCAEVSEQFG